MLDLGQLIRTKFIPSVAFSVTSQRPTADRPLKPPETNWAKALATRHPELQARRVSVLDWSRHEKTIYGRITYWFEAIGRILQDPAILEDATYTAQMNQY